MATAPLDHPVNPSTTALRVVAKVGVATWIVIAEPSALDELRADDSVDQSRGGVLLSPVGIHRIMEGVRAKAVGLRWYGGGRLSIDSSELAPAPLLVIDEDGQEILPRPWFEIVAIVPSGQPVLHIAA